MNGLNYHDEMVKNIMNATYQGNTAIPKEIPVKIFTQEALKEHDKQIVLELIDEILSGCVCNYDGDCMGNRESCKTCSNYVIDYQSICSTIKGAN